tara:strand:- start:915 stop:2444 length:1530 start_codon:yes stop_codon:yes gene_type:complete
MEFSTIKSSIETEKSDAIILGFFQKEFEKFESNLVVNKLVDGYLNKLFDKGEISGKQSEITLIHTPDSFYKNIKSEKIIILGLGQRDKFNHNIFREVISKLSTFCVRNKILQVITSLPCDLYNINKNFEIFSAFSEGFYLGTYNFDKYKTKINNKSEIKNINIITPEQFPRVDNYINNGKEFALAECFARDLVNEPANVLSPEKFSEFALEISKDKRIECNVYDSNQINSFGMGAFLGVASGSERPPKLIHLIYEGDKSNPENNIWIIGKTITFDTGGISLKSPLGMSAMKGDMGGGAAVISAFKSICKYNPKININVILPATDNMPSGSAQKPGDVVTAMNGMTIEVDNTDAEGRLTIADAVCFAKNNDASIILDIATLTGAARVALGEGQSAIFSNNKILLSMFLKSSEITGESFWELPLDSVSKKQNFSDIADIKNTGGRSAGTITAAHFISEFVGDIPWIHVDIAATSILSSGRSWYKKGATGVTTRTIIRLILDTLSVKKIINR